MKTVIGTFTAKDARNRMRTVVISQELMMGKTNVVESAVKHLNLDDQDGEDVMFTDDPVEFRLNDGSKLRRVSSIKLGDDL